MNRLASTKARCALLQLVLLLSAIDPSLATESVTLRVATPMVPPSWAVLERELLRANSRACEQFFDRYFDDRGFLECVERWGGDDGPDDAIENVADWPILHALGAPDTILDLYKRAWEGHLRQYTRARTTDVVFARDGMYYKEFPVMFDWMHNGEGLRVFNLQGLSDPNDLRFRQRVVRYAGFYLNEDPGAPNYDPVLKIIRSLFTAVVVRCSVRRRPSTGPATPSRSRTVSGPTTARRAIARCWSTSGTTPPSSATTHKTSAPRRWP